MLNYVAVAHLARQEKELISSQLCLTYLLIILLTILIYFLPRFVAMTDSSPISFWPVALRSDVIIFRYVERTKSYMSSLDILVERKAIKERADSYSTEGIVVDKYGSMSP